MIPQAARHYIDRLLDDGLGRLHFWITFLGTYAIFFPMHYLGILGMPRDGYVALFTWAELFNSRLGDQVLVISEIDGKPLSQTEGPYALRSFGDIKPSPRHVKWLQQIEVIKLAP